LYRGATQVIEILKDNRSEKEPASSKHRRRGVRLLLAFGVVLAFGWVLSFLGYRGSLLTSLTFSLDGWLLVFAAFSFALADPEHSAFDGACGAVVGAVTMLLLLGGWSSLGQVAVSFVSGAFVGAVFSVPLGWMLRTARSKLVRARNKPEPVPADLRDPWVDP